MIRPEEAWVLACLVADQRLNGELDALADPWKSMANHLAALPAKGKVRKAAFEAMLAARTERDEILAAMAAIDPSKAQPAARPDATFATAADIRRLLDVTRWIWEGWIPAKRIVGVAAFEGTGKTRFLLDLARRIYQGEEWPDGQPATLPPGTRTVWICADGHHDELVEMLPAFGLPDDAIIFPAPPDEPYNGTDIDLPEFIGPNGILETVIQTTKPGLVIVDTLTNATSRNLCAQDQMKGLKDPLVRIVQQFSTIVVLSLHLNKEGQALGRRIKGITRTLMHLECPDLERLTVGRHIT